MWIDPWQQEKLLFREAMSFHKCKLHSESSHSDYVEREAVPRKLAFWFHLSENPLLLQDCTALALSSERTGSRLSSALALQALLLESASWLRAALHGEQKTLPRLGSPSLLFFRPGCTAQTGALPKRHSRYDHSFSFSFFNVQLVFCLHV